MQPDHPDTLNAIRQAETDTTRQLTIAREAAQVALDDARQQARDLQTTAEADGRAAGTRALQAATSAAETRAADLVAAARDRAAAMQELPPADVAAAVERLVALICGRPGGQDEA